jgi:molecular chaperone DnaK
MPAVIGIDLGTTKSVVGVWKDGKCHIIPDYAGYHSTPSLVVVTADERILAGRRAQIFPDRYKSKNITIGSVKRLMGRKGETGWGWWKAYPQEVSAFILAELKSQAESYLGEEINQAVTAIPSHFDEAQRRATKEAAEIAGLEVLRLLNEATAAALTYGFHKRGQETTLVLDFGGGTLDISVVERGEQTYSVRTIEGDTKLGGDDFDQVIIDYILLQTQRQYGSAIEWDPVQRAVLREAAEKAKLELSSTSVTSIHIPGFLRIGKNYRDLDISLSRQTFEQRSRILVDRATILLKRALYTAHLKASDLGSLLLLGGTSRIPFVRESVRKELGLEPITGVDIETCVAEGAAIQAAVLGGALRDVLLLDCTPSSYGIALVGGVFSSLIDKNSTVPTSRSQNFSTTADNQTAISINIYQGERPMVSDNSFLGTVELRDIVPAKEGVPQVQVTFEVDANMIVRVSALDLGTSKKQAIAVKSPYGLNSAQTRVMRQRLRSWLSERRIAELKAEARVLISAIEEILAERATALGWDEVLLLRERGVSLSGSITREISYQELKDMVFNTRSLVNEAQQEIAQHEKTLQQVDSLTARVAILTPFIVSEIEQEFGLFRQGVDLLREYLRRGSSDRELQDVLLAVTSTYEETAASIIEREIRNLRTSGRMAEWVVDTERVLFSPSLVRRSLSVLKTIDSIELIVKLLRMGDGDHHSSIQEKVSDGIRGDSYSEACLLLVVSSFVDHDFMSDIFRIPLNKNNSPILAFSIFNSLEKTNPEVVRRTAARIGAEFLPDITYIAPIIARIDNEEDSAVKKSLLSYVDRQSPGVFKEFYFGADMETKARIVANKDLLLKLATEPDAGTCMFALESLASFSAEDVVPAFVHFAHSQDHDIRVKAMEQILKYKFDNLQVSDLFARALSDPVSNVRLLAIGFIEQKDGPSCISSMLTILESEKDESVRKRAVAALCGVNDPGVIPHLLRLLLGESQSIRAIVASSLEKDRQTMDKDVQKVFELALETAAGANTGGLIDSVFLWRFSKRHPEMKDFVRALKDCQVGNRVTASE